jgi:hypothetical protein
MLGQGGVGLGGDLRRQELLLGREDQAGTTGGAAGCQLPARALPPLPAIQARLTAPKSRATSTAGMPDAKARSDRSRRSTEYARGIVPVHHPAAILSTISRFALRCHINRRRANLFDPGCAHGAEQSDKSF